MNVCSVAWKNLFRRPARSLLTMAGIGGAVAAVVALVGLSRGLEQSFLELYTRQGTDLVVQRRGGTVQIAKGLPLRLANEIRAFPECSQVISGLMDMVAFEEQGLFMVIANGWEPDSPVLRRVTLREGRKLRPGDGRHVMLGKILAANLGKRPGDTVELYAQPFEVVGIFESFSVYENGAVFLIMDELQKQMDRAGQATGFVVQANPPGDAQSIAALQGKIEALDPEIAATPCAEFVSELNQMKVTRAMSWVVSLIAASIGAIGAFNTVAMTIAERSAEIGALRAIGWRASRVARLITAESLLLALGGAVLGSVAGLATLSLLSRWPPTSGLVQGEWPWQAVLQGSGLAALMVLAGGLFSAFRIARLQPLDALRGR